MRTRARTGLAGTALLGLLAALGPAGPAAAAPQTAAPQTAAPQTAAPQTATPPPGQRSVLFVGNNWAGTADIVDPTTFRRLKRIDVVPDKQARLAEIRSDPVKLGYYLAVQQLIGEGHDQYVDDMFTSRDGRFVYASRPSLADVVSIELATGKIVWRVRMDGYRSDHMAISPDGRRLLVSDSTAKKVHVIDVAVGKKVAAFASGDSPHESNYSHDGSKIFHASIGTVYTPADRPVLDTSKGARFFQVVDGRTYRVLRRVDLGKVLAEQEAEKPGDQYPDNGAIRPMALSPDEKTAYFQLSFFHGYVVYDIARRRITRVVHLPNRVPDLPREQYLLDSAHHGLSINPAGTKLCVAGTMSDYAAIVPVARPRDRVVVGGIDKPYWSTNSADGRFCYVSSSGADEVVVLSYATGKVVKRFPVGDHPQRIRLGSVRSALFDGATTVSAASVAAPVPLAAAADDGSGRDVLPAVGALGVLLAGAGLLRRRRSA